MSEHKLPENPSLRHLKDQAKDILRAGFAATLTEAQLFIARQYGFPNWTKLKASVEARLEIGKLRRAIDTNDLPGVRDLMTRSPELHRAPLGYGGNGPLTWVAECRVPWQSPPPERLAIAEWMIRNGSDVHQGGDGPLMRAALNGDRIPMMELLVAHGANVNAQWGGTYPIIFAPCEAVDPRSLEWLLRHGAEPNNANGDGRGTALDYVIGAYVRSPELTRCIDLLVDAGCPTKYFEPAVLDLLRNRLDALTAHLERDPALIHRRFPDLDFGATGGRMLTLRGATLLHVAAEYLNSEATGILLRRGADVNARAHVDDAGVGGQTPAFHAATQFEGRGQPMLDLLVRHGADLSLRARVPGHYERPGEVVECNAVGYGALFGKA